MYGIPLYPPACRDFSTNGLGLMLPCECTVEELANGRYELTMTQPIGDDLRWAQAQVGCLLKAAVPVRESPLYEREAQSIGAQTTTTVLRRIYRVNTAGSRLHLRQEPSLSGRILGRYPADTEVALLDAQGDWMRVAVCSGGVSGWMYAAHLQYVRDAAETMTVVRPVTREAMRVLPAREQLFRIYSVENDTGTGMQTVRAMHVFYDLRGCLVAGPCSPAGMAADEAAAQAFARAVNDGSFALHAAHTDGTVTADYGYRSIVEALLEPENGIAAQGGYRLVRDNFDVFLIPDAVRDMGVTVRRGKNLTGVTVVTDDSQAVTRLIPVGRDEQGGELYLSDPVWTDSPRASDYPVIRAQKREYDVRVGDGYADAEAARAELRRRAQADFEAGADLPDYGMSVSFVLLKEEGAQDYDALQSVHLFDTVTVIDELIGLKAKVCVTGYVWDVLTEQYESVTLGEIRALSQKTYGYSIANGTISGSKLISGSVDGAVLRDMTIQYAKIAAAAIRQLNAEAITAVTAHLNEVIAGSITTDELYAAVAQILALEVGSITADNIETDALAAVLGEFVKLYADFAGVDFADIRDLTADEFIFRVGVAGEVYIDRLAVTSANIIAAVLGELVLRGDDGGYYRLHVRADSTIVAEQIAVTQDEIASGVTGGGQTIVGTSANIRDLNAQSIRAASAVITEIFTDALTAGRITAGQAMIASASVPELYTTAIAALGDSIDITANSTIQLLIGMSEQLRAWFTFGESGMSVGRQGSAYTTLTDDTGFHVLQNNEKIGSFARRQLETEAVRIGRVSESGPRIVMREAADGGMVIVLEGSS